MRLRYGFVLLAGWVFIGMPAFCVAGALQHQHTCTEIAHPVHEHGQHDCNHDPCHKIATIRVRALTHSAKPSFCPPPATTALTALRAVLVCTVTAHPQLQIDPPDIIERSLPLLI